MHQEERHLPNTCFHDLNSDSENATLRVVTLDPSHIWYAPVLTERPQTTDLTWKPATSLGVVVVLTRGFGFLSLVLISFSFFFFEDLFLFFLSVSVCLHICMCVWCQWRSEEGQDPPELSHKELWVTM